MEKKRKPRTAKLSRHADMPCKSKAKDAPKLSVRNDAPRSSVRPVMQKRLNLTLHDWLTVFAFIDSHPDMSQENVVTYFKTRAEGALYFDQSTLSRKLKNRFELELRVNDNPNALSSKRPRIVTRPDVEIFL